jgi:hypothetical protein
MRHIKLTGFAFLIAAALMSCAATANRKSADYYLQNKNSINGLRQLYEQLYSQQAFAVGFTDKSCKYYVMEVRTDTVRYIYNTEKNKPQIYATVAKFQYDTAMLKELSIKMKAIKCLWLSKSSFYVNEKKETITFLSFKSTTIENPFVDNKYYILIFLDHPITSEDIRTKIKKGDLVKIDDLVYFTIGSNFR